MIKPLDPEDVRQEISKAIRQTDISSGNGFQPPPFHRPILSTIDTYDQNTQVEHLSEAFSTGRRPIWNIPQIAVVSTKVGTIKQSASVTTVAPTLATQSGIIPNAITNLASFVVVPNMSAVLKASGPVQVTFSVNVQTANANDPVTFGIFRNGIQVSQSYQGSGAAATAFTVSATYTDNPPLGTQVYDVRWKKGSSQVTAVQKQRTIQALNLRAQ